VVNSNLQLKLPVLIAVLLSLICLSAAHGQSGRRTPKPKTVVTPAPEAEPTPAPKKQTSEPTLTFILGIDQNDGFSNVTLNTLSGVRRNLGQRLAESDGIRVEISQRSMSRGDAVKQAKAEKDSYMVWVQVKNDTMRTAQNENQNAYIEYTVFAPGSGKVETSGSSYPQNRSKDILGRRTTDIDGDYFLNRAAREAAERILAKFGRDAPRRWPATVRAYQVSLPE
jgi:hypothetical protein